MWNIKYLNFKGICFICISSQGQPGPLGIPGPQGQPGKDGTPGENIIQGLLGLPGVKVKMSIVLESICV